MHPRIAELLVHLDTQRRELWAAVESVPAEHREAQPAPDRWSVAGVLEHLGALESRLTGLFTRRIADARTAGVGPDTATDSILAALDMARLLDRTRRLTAPDIVQPRSSLDWAAAWSALEKARLGLRAMILDADGFALGEIKHSHVAFGEMDLYQWIAFVGGHEARHAAQIREIGAQLAQERAELEA